MNLIKVLHETAMEYVDFADRAKRNGDAATYNDLIKKAYLLEKEAALKCITNRRKLKIVGNTFC